MTQDVDVAAISWTVHEALRAWAASHGQADIPAWTDAPTWMKSSTEESVLFVLHHPQAGPGAQHEQWIAQKLADGWKLGPEKDADKKTHPMMKPFSELSVFEQRKDTLLRSVVLALTGPVSTD